MGAPRAAIHQRHREHSGPFQEAPGVTGQTDTRTDPDGRAGGVSRQAVGLPRSGQAGDMWSSAQSWER